MGKLNRRYNAYEINEEYGVGYASDGKEFYFDLEDYEKIKNYCWHISKDGYVCTTLHLNFDVVKTLLMHKLLVDFQMCDHINGIRHDNRKENLRSVTESENAINKKLLKSNTSGFTGVSFDKKSGKWRARVSINSREITLGFFINKNDAIEIRRKAEDKYYGDYSRRRSRGK